jgi:DNA repair protein SbcC/Rad50
VKIERLEVSGLRSHRGNPPTCLDLSDKRLVAIVGHTGAGKSSLLEAITFALFGEATYGGRAYEELSSDGRSEISVQMAFTVGDERYQMVRTVRPNRNGVFGAKATWLRRIDEEGTTLTHTEGVRNVDRAISNLLGGMSREQFCQAVLLAQNRFAALLEADPRERDALLDTLLGLSALHDARKALQATRKAAQENVVRLTFRRETLPPDPAAEARRAKLRASAMSTIAEEAEEGARELSELSTKAAALTKDADDLEKAAVMRTTRGGSDGLAGLGDAAADLEELIRSDERLLGVQKVSNEALEAAQSRLTNATTNLAAVEQEHGQLGRHQIIAERLKQLSDLLAEKPGHEKTASDSEAAVSNLQGELEQASSAAAIGMTSAERQREAEQSVLKTATAAATALASAERVVELADDAVKRMLPQTDLVESAFRDLGLCETEVAEAGRALEPVAEQRDRTRRALEYARRSEAAATAAHDCQPGDDCPVCDRRLPQGWEPPVSGQLDSAQEAVNAAEHVFDKASQDHRNATEKRAGAVSRLRTALSGVAATHLELVKLAEARELALVPSPDSELEPPKADPAQLKSAVAAIKTLRVQMGHWCHTLRETLAPLRQARDAAQEVLTQTSQDLAAAETALAEADRVVNDINNALASATSAHGAAVRTLQDSENRLLSTLSGVDDRWRSMIDLAEAQTLLAASTTLAADQEEVDAAARERELAEDELRTHDRAIQTLASQRAIEVTAPLGAVVHRLVTLADVVNDLAVRLGMSESESIEKSASPAALAQATKRLESKAKKAKEEADARTAELRLQVEALVVPAAEVVSSLVALISEVDPTGAEIGEAPDPEDPLGTGTRDRVQRIVGGAGQLAKEAIAAATQAKKGVTTAKELDKRIEALTTWRSDLDGAIDVLKKDNFPTWARTVRIADLVDTSSEILSQMTSSRYRFDSALRISDEVAGIVRKASTLSGGEKFEASLALALGVSEIAGRSGVRIDTLFLDEGFAGLDQSHLNRALDALENEVEAGRCIVLITHIGSVADRIQDVLLVQPDGVGGSTMRWLNDEERFELGADLDLAIP